MWVKSFIILFFCAVIASKAEAPDGSATCEYVEVKSRRFRGYLCKLKFDNGEIVNSIEGNHVEDKYDDDVQYVSGSNLTFKTLTQIFCDNFKNTERISIFKSDVNRIDENALENCKKLQLFDFQDTQVGEVPGNLFAENHQLSVIKLSRNHITTLPEDIFSNLHDLQKLFMYKNEISYLPPNIFKSNTKLSGIYLSDNKLTAINSKWFENVPDLKRLDLSFNQILDLPKNAFVNLQKLSLIWLANNNLTSIHSDSFGVNRNFTQLYVENNKINAIDEKFIDDTEIHKLDMKGNVCSQHDANNRFEMKEAFQKCFNNYQARDE